MTSVIPTSDSPQLRLMASRKALVRQMARVSGNGDYRPNGAGRYRPNGRGDDHFDSVNADGLLDANHDTAGTDSARSRSSTWQLITQAVMAWWQHHPAQIAVDVGRPFLMNYAQKKPLQLLGIAAGLGAAAVLVKPWRLVSITGLAVAAFKSSRISSTLLSLLPRAAARSQSDKPP